MFEGFCCMEQKDSAQLLGPYPKESKADQKRMAQVAPVFKQLAQALAQVVRQHDQVRDTFIKERTAAGEKVDNNSAQVELCLRLEECTKSFDGGLQALYSALKVLRLIGRRELMVEALWDKVYAQSKTFEKKGQLSTTEAVDATIAVKKLRAGESKLLDELELCLLKAQSGNDAKAQQTAQAFLAQLPTLRAVLGNAQSSCSICRGLKWLKDC